MAVSDVLKNLRTSGYGDSQKPDEKEESSSSRVISLTDDEVKSLGMGGPGEEVTLQVTGKLEGTHFHVMGVQGQGGGTPEDDSRAVAEGIVGKLPSMPTQTIPSPS